MIELLQAAALGLIQGVTEFLPISSSAHLVLTSHLLGWQDEGLDFDIGAHLGSLVALVVYFRRELYRLGRGLLHADRGSGRGSIGSRRRFLLILIVATLPVALTGWLLRDFVATTGRSPVLIASTSILFGVLMWWADRAGSARFELWDLGWRAGCLIGLAQALALFPGTSRSGVTLTAGLLLGFSRAASVRFSFLLALPLGVLVAIGQLLDLGAEGGGLEEPEIVAIGFAASAVSAYASIGWLLSWLARQGLTVFVVYRIALGLMILSLWAVGR